MERKLTIRTGSGRVTGILNSPKGARKIAILVHGFTGTVNEFGDLKDRLALKGVSSFSYNSGISKPMLVRLNKTTVSGEVRNLKGLIRAFAKEYLEVYLVGASFGGLISILSWLPAVRKIALWYPLSFPKESNTERNNLTQANLDELKKTGKVALFRRSGLKYYLCKKFIDECKRFSAKDTAGRIRAKVLVMHGTRDRGVPFRQSKRLMALLKNCEEKKLVPMKTEHVWRKPGGTGVDAKALEKVLRMTADFISKG